MTSQTYADAIARSISHNEIAYVDLEDQLAILRTEAGEAGDLDTCQTISSILRDDDNDDDDDTLATSKALRGLISQIIDGADGVEDSVHNGDVWEAWGTTDDGDEWRVHMRLDHLAHVYALIS